MCPNHTMRSQHQYSKKPHKKFSVVHAHKSRVFFDETNIHDNGTFPLAKQN